VELDAVGLHVIHQCQDRLHRGQVRDQDDRDVGRHESRQLGRTIAVDRIFGQVRDARDQSYRIRPRGDRDRQVVVVSVAADLDPNPRREPQILWRCRSFLPMTIFWISDVPSPMSSSGASRYRRSISYSLEYP
jgi:hypothetical protein